MSDDFELPSSSKTTTFKSATGKESSTSDILEKSTEEDLSAIKASKIVSTPKYSDEELEVIFDSLMFENEYVESISLRNNKLKLSFKSRTASEISDIMNRLDKLGANLALTHEHYRTTYNLAYGLVSYQGNDLASLTLNQRLEAIGKIPGQVLVLIIKELQKFDDKVQRAVEHGEANF